MPAEREVMRKRYERFQMEVDIREPLKQGCYVEGRDGMDTWIQFKYKRLPNFYKHCGALNHDLARCPTGGGERKFGLWMRAESEEKWKPPEEESEEPEDGREEDDESPGINGGDEETVARMWEAGETNNDTRTNLQKEHVEEIEVIKKTCLENKSNGEERQAGGRKLQKKMQATGQERKEGRQ